MTFVSLLVLSEGHWYRPGSSGNKIYSGNKAACMCSVVSVHTMSIYHVDADTHLLLGYTASAL